MIHLLQQALSFFWLKEPAKIRHIHVYTHMGHHYNIMMSTEELTKGISSVYIETHTATSSLYCTIPLKSWNQSFEHALSHVVKFYVFDVFSKVSNLFEPPVDQVLSHEFDVFRSLWI